MATLTSDKYSNLAGGGTTSAPPVVRKLTFQDLEIALQRGLDDFRAVPSHAVMLCLIYPVVGLVLARLVLGYEVLPLLFPLAAGFALIGPFAAIGLYELSCRREQGLDLSASHAFNVLRSPSFGAMLALGALLFVLFGVWVATALLVVGSSPAFLGLAIVVPVLGHATWHLYRRAVESTGAASHETPEPVKKPRYAADFPASLFSRSDR